MKLIGLTGGIASGKSTVAGFFHKLGVPVINTDEISAELTMNDLPTINEIIKVFGSQIMVDGKIAKPLLKKIIFADEDKRKSLENILHPRIKKHMLAQIAKLNTPYVIIEVPLLIEAGWDKLMDQVLLTSAPISVRMRRLIKRDKISPELAKKIIGTQAYEADKKKLADDILNTEQSLKKLEAFVLNLHHKYLQL